LRKVSAVKANVSVSSRSWELTSRAHPCEMDVNRNDNEHFRIFVLLVIIPLLATKSLEMVITGSFVGTTHIYLNNTLVYTLGTDSGNRWSE
jgi:hypothetical protein